MQANQRRSGRVFGCRVEKFRREGLHQYGPGQYAPGRPQTSPNPRFGTGLHGTKNGQSGYYQEDEVNSSPPRGCAAAARARTRLRDKQERRGQAVNHTQKAGCRSNRIRFEGKRYHGIGIRCEISMKLYYCNTVALVGNHGRTPQNTKPRIGARCIPQRPGGAVCPASDGALTS